MVAIPPADGIFDHKVHFGVGYEVEFDLSELEGHGPGEGRESWVVQTVEVMFLEDVSPEMLEYVGQE